MNKNIKKIIAFTIICTAFSTWMPSALNIGNQYAYAYSDDKITHLKVTSGVSVIPIYSSIAQGNEYRIKGGEEVPIVVYSKISSDKASIKLNTIETEAADIRVFVGKNNQKIDDIYSEIKIEKGEKKSIHIRLYDSKNDADDKYTIEYELVVERKDDNGEDETELQAEPITLKEYDNIYLDELALSNNDNGQKIDLNFDKTQPIYNINIDEDISSIKIKAVPEKESYKLRINGEKVDTNGHDDNKDTEEVFLSKGQNIIEIRIISDAHETREYYLNVTRGKVASATTTSNNTTENKSSQNIQTGSNWQYRKADGTMAIGWICIGNEWYYFDSTGALKTGWLQDDTGKWYYLKESGAMAKDTTIDGYKIGPDGVCITK